jgi:FKBP-type peptidyl-prolyl cis-trans isomerase SlyD
MSLKVEKDRAVSVQIEIVEGGKVSPKQEMTYLHGGYGHLFPKIEAALNGLEAGAQTKVTVAPADGFGERDPLLVKVEPRSRLPEGAVVGSVLQGPAAEDGRPGLVFRVTALTDQEATLDGNHPLAGHTVELRLAVLDVRAATDEEIAHGHVHGPEGHAH